MTKLLVTGGRNFNDLDFEIDLLMRFHAYRPVTQLITGAADGADLIAMAWAEEMGIPHRDFPVTDSHWKRLGKKAGMVRNQQMLDEGDPEAVLAMPGGNGTAHMVGIASDIPWIEVWQSKKVLFNRKDPDYAFCSNFAEGFDFADEDGLWWASSEHYYQAQKTLDPNEQFAIQNAPSASQARKLGQSIKLRRSGWEQLKLDVMRQALRYKFAVGSRAAQLLLDTGLDYLVEYAPWGDTFFGVNADLVGHNWLGRLLNERRTELLRQ